MVLVVTISTHTTSSFPTPHILYNLHVSEDGRTDVVGRRYSDFIALNKTLAVSGIPLPPKRILVTTFIPSAWMDDSLVQERKTGLAIYLSTLLETPKYQDHPALLDFLKPSSPSNDMQFHPEDAIPSTFPRKTALAEAEASVANARGPVAGYPGHVSSTFPRKTVLASIDEPSVANMNGPISAGYYPDWSAEGNPPENINFSKFDIIFFAFAMPNPDGSLNWDSWSQNILSRLIGAVNDKGTKIVLSVGGWGGSAGFSSAANEHNRSNFVKLLVNVVQTFKLDGIDIDWEYPNSTGAGNPHSPDDAGNLLKLFQELRKALGPNKIISAAVPHLPWLGPDGQPLNDISAYAHEMTYINIMNYDVWGASENPGPNAPLNNGCGTSTQPQASAEAALKQWTSAGAPASKLLLGLPLYGYVSKSSKTTLTGSFAPPRSSVSDEKKAHAHSRTGSLVRNQNRPEAQAGDVDLRSFYGQQIPFKTLVSSGALVKNSDGNYGAGGGFTMGWDDCSDTPYLFKPAHTTVVTYDDTWSLGDKAAYARERGMAGCFTWSLDQDDEYSLQNVIRSQLGQ